MWLAVITLPLALQACGRSPKTQVIDAIEAKFPQGQRRCLDMASLPGIHVPRQNGVLYYPATGPTSTIRHAFVFYAAPADQPVPELVADLLDRGMLRRERVQATTDRETSAPSPQVLTAAGFRDASTLLTHRITRFAVDIYETRPHDPAFQYEFKGGLDRVLGQPVTFPSRPFETALPPPDRHYAVPTIGPYLTSIVTGACLMETPERVQAIRVRDASDGGHFMEADVLFAQHPPAWMRTRAFRHAALGPTVEWIDRPRLATVVLRMSQDGTLSYDHEALRW